MRGENRARKVPQVRRKLPAQVLKQSRGNYGPRSPAARFQKRSAAEEPDTLCPPQRPLTPAVPAKAAGAGGRMSVAEMMAAARAEKEKAAAGGAAEAKPAAAKPAAAKPAPAKTAAAKAPAAEKAAAKPAAPAKAAMKPTPAEPLPSASILAAARGEKPGPMTVGRSRHYEGRRRFFGAAGRRGESQACRSTDAAKAGVCRAKEGRRDRRASRRAAVARRIVSRARFHSPVRYRRRVVARLLTPRSMFPICLNEPPE